MWLTVLEMVAAGAGRAVTLSVVPVMMRAVVVAVVPAALVGPCGDFHVCGRDTRANDPRDLQLVLDAQAAERAPQAVNRQPRIDEGAEHHVPGRASEALDVQDPGHQRHSASLIEQ
jgi:hypothetical protein